MPIVPMPNYEAEMQMHNQNIFSQLLSNMMLQRMAQSYKQKELDMQQKWHENQLNSQLLIHGAKPSPATTGAPEGQPPQEQGLLSKIFGPLLNPGGQQQQQNPVQVVPPEPGGRAKIQVGQVNWEMPDDNQEPTAKPVYSPGPDGQPQFVGTWVQKGKSHTFQPAREAKEPKYAIDTPHGVINVSGEAALSHVDKKPETEYKTPQVVDDTFKYYGNLHNQLKTEYGKINPISGQFEVDPKKAPEYKQKATELQQRLDKDLYYINKGVKPSWYSGDNIQQTYQQKQEDYVNQLLQPHIGGY